MKKGIERRGNSAVFLFAVGIMSAAFYFIGSFLGRFRGGQFVGIALKL